MAKEFKNWDKKFSRYELDEQRRFYGGPTSFDCSYWPFGYIQPINEVVRHAVYEADGVEDWQRFRVSLKGVSTSTKINMLINYWLIHYNDELTSIRVWNYIGALRRGGQLNEKLEVIK